MYRDEEGPSAPVKVLDQVCHRIPVHLILGDRPDFMCVFLRPCCFHCLEAFSAFSIRPKPVQKALVDPKADREFASVKYVPNTGHLVGVLFPYTFRTLLYLFNLDRFYDIRMLNSLWSRYLRRLPRSLLHLSSTRYQATLSTNRSHPVGYERYQLQHSSTVDRSHHLYKIIPMTNVNTQILFGCPFVVDPTVIAAIGSI